MKYTWKKRIFSGILAACLTACALTPVAAPAATATESPLADAIDTNDMNPAYLDWLADGQKGPMPAAQDFSYLNESYANLLSTPQPYASNGAATASRFDLRDQGLVDPVTNQGDLGICWAIAANSAAAGSIRDQFPELVLSPLHTAWFCYHGKEEEEFTPFTGSYLSGGNDGRAVGTLAAWKGPVNTSAVPFKPTDQPTLDESLRYAADYHLQDAYYMPNGVYFGTDQDTSVNTTITKALLTSIGPVSVNYYSHGLNSYNPDTYAVYNSHKQRTDHAVLIVGWDDDFPKENFVAGNQPAHDGAWLVRNSWGPEWGDDGYFWLSYEDKTLVSGNAYLLEEADNYAKNYQYDTTGWSYSIATDPANPKTATAANIFTAESDEQLEAVSFYTTDAGTSYEISIYTDVEPGQPQSGQKMLSSQRGREAYAGYHTIELNEAVELSEGDRFSIVVTFTNPTYENPLAIEWCPIQSPNDVPIYMGNGGESYVLTDGGWKDIAGASDAGFYITNACIKGFTNPLPKSGAAVPTVHFSEMAGPITDGTTLSLSAAASADIYWSDGGAFQHYDGAIPLDRLDQAGDSVTIRAYAEINGQRGNTVSKTYTRASAGLADLAIKHAQGVVQIDTTQGKEQQVVIPKNVETVQVMAQSGDQIHIDGQPLASADWSTPIAIDAEHGTRIAVTVSASGKTPQTITLDIIRSDSGEPGDRTPHAIRFDSAPEHGQITLSADSASLGSEITLTVTPDEGYVLDSLSAVTPSHRDIEIRALGNSTYAFTMPDEAVTLSASFILRSDSALPFTDVHESDWFYDPVTTVYRENIMHGVSDTRFAPNDTVTRAMVWAVLARQSGADTATTTPWYAGVQQWAQENGVSDGLHPLNSVTREELITMLYRFHGTPETSGDLSAYEDAAAISDFAANAMRWGVECGLISGLTDTTLAPQHTATRAQLAAILARDLNR